MPLDSRVFRSYIPTCFDVAEGQYSLVNAPRLPVVARDTIRLAEFFRGRYLLTSMRPKAMSERRVPTRRESNGGADGGRTRGLLNAIQTRSQLRHSPT